MIRKLKSGEYRLYSRKVDPKSHKRKNLGTFKSREAAADAAKCDTSSVTSRNLPCRDCLGNVANRGDD